jgi:SAM-dependent methyltransferase
MTEQQIRKASRLRIVYSGLLKPPAILSFWLIRWFCHNQFLLRLKNKKVGSPNPLILPLDFADRCWRFTRKSWNQSYANYALKRYRVFIGKHYSSEGVGYFNYDSLSEGDRIAEFEQLGSRLAFYLEHNKVVLDFADGDTFLDAGCGKGQNIKELTKRYPNSQIRGFDVNAGALGVIQTALKDNDNVRVEQGSLADLKYLREYPDNSIDHIVVSHVFSFLADIDLSATSLLRQSILDQLSRIAKKTLIILDDNIGPTTGFKIVIEQNTRCFFRESLSPYFEVHRDIGELYFVLSPLDQAFVFKKTHLL